MESRNIVNTSKVKDTLIPHSSKIFQISSYTEKACQNYGYEEYVAHNGFKCCHNMPQIPYYVKL